VAVELLAKLQRAVHQPVDRDGGAVIAQLSQLNVPYRNADAAPFWCRRQGARGASKLASQGLPKGSVVGFELLEGKNSADPVPGAVNYQRGLEGELARSIQSLLGRRRSRSPGRCRKTRLPADHQAPTASVLLQLHPARRSTGPRLPASFTWSPPRCPS